jgi:centromeric protein E
MRGNDDDPGMMILCIRDIFDHIESHPNTKFSLKVSYMEVYNEEINDLLGEGPSSKNLRIVSDDAVKGASIQGKK